MNQCLMHLILTHICIIPWVSFNAFWKQIINYMYAAMVNVYFLNLGDFISKDGSDFQRTWIPTVEYSSSVKRDILWWK